MAATMVYAASLDDLLLLYCLQTRYQAVTIYIFVNTLFHNYPYRKLHLKKENDELQKSLTKAVRVAQETRNYVLNWWRHLKKNKHNIF